MFTRSVCTTPLEAGGGAKVGVDDVTLSVPKLFFGYATGSNLLFPFAAGGHVDTVAERYGLTTHGTAAWLEATQFAPRGAFDPEIARTTLATLRRAGFTD